MEKFVKRIWVPLLLVALGIALSMEFSSVETIDLDTTYSPRLREAPIASGEPVARQPAGQPKLPSHRTEQVLGKHYPSIDELIADQQALGFVRVGAFGNHWPATITEIATDKDQITFVKRDGVQHSYEKFDGYRMKMVRLLDASRRETIVVFRSVDKG